MPWQKLAEKSTHCHAQCFPAVAWAEQMRFEVGGGEHWATTVPRTTCEDPSPSQTPQEYMCFLFSRSLPPYPSLSSFFCCFTFMSASMCFFPILVMLEARSLQPAFQLDLNHGRARCAIQLLTKAFFLDTLANILQTVFDIYWFSVNYIHLYLSVLSTIVYKTKVAAPH